MVTLPSSAKYFAEATRYLRRNYWIQMRAEIVRELIGDVRGKRILDLGCGNGAISLPFSSVNKLVLVDNSAAMLRAARSQAHTFNSANCQFIEADAGQANLGKFDIVLAIGLLAHVDSIEEALASISAHLVPGGSAVVQFSPCERLLNRLGFWLLRMRGRGYRAMTTNDVLKCAAANGLTPVSERRHLVVLPGMQRVMGRSLIHYDRFVRRHATLAKHGSEMILMLRKH